MGMKLVDVLYEPVIKVRCFIRQLQSYSTWWTGYWVCPSLPEGPTHHTDVREVVRQRPTAVTSRRLCRGQKASWTTAGSLQAFTFCVCIKRKLFVVTIKQHFWLLSRRICRATTSILTHSQIHGIWFMLVNLYNPFVGVYEHTIERWRKFWTQQHNYKKCKYRLWGSAVLWVRLQLHVFTPLWFF